MSKVVKSVGRAIGKVVKGVVNAVKSVAKSKIGKVILVAAAVYFGGAALLGATGTSGAAAAGGLSGLSGATANISAAWTSLGSATTAAMQGKFLAAGDALASGFAGNAWGAPSVAAAGTAVPAAVAPVAEGAAVVAPVAEGAALTTPGAAGYMGGGQGLSASGSSFAPSVGTGVNAVPAAVGSGSAVPTVLPPLSSGAAGANGYAALGSAMKTGALINAGTSLVGGLVNNRAAEGQREFELQQAQAARDRYNANAGSMWWGSPAGGSNVYAQPAPSGLIAGAMTPSQRYAEDVRARMQAYDPYAVRRG